MATKRTDVFLVRATPNFGKRRTVKSFKSKRKAISFIKKITSKPKKRVLPSGKKITLTSFRNAQSGTGLNNPRIKKIKSFV